jgi:hypothetical protein
LLLEVAGIGGGMVSVVLAPGLLAAGVGALIFVGLDKLTGFGTFSLAVPDIPAATTPTVGEFTWAVGIGLAAAVVGTGIRRIGLQLTGRGHQSSAPQTGKARQGPGAQPRLGLSPQCDRTPGSVPVLRRQRRHPEPAHSPSDAQHAQRPASARDLGRPHGTRARRSGKPGGRSSRRSHPRPHGHAQQRGGCGNRTQILRLGAARW